jgi:hypothetical protein
MKEIQLNNGMVALIDDDDYEKVNCLKWRALCSKNKHTPDKWYATCNIKTNIIIYLHRFILNVHDSRTHIDHKDGNGLNCQKGNIRSCTQSQNNKNITPRTGGTSKYKGVWYFKKNRKFTAKICINRKQTYLGSFLKESDAAKAYNDAAIKYYGEFAYLNTITNK